MAEFSVRYVEESELPEYVTARSRGFGGQPRPDEAERARHAMREIPFLGAFEGSRVVGASAAFTSRMTIPGGSTVPVAAITGVSVLPTHRRRGLLTMMMRRMLDEARARHEPIAALYASETPIYGRFGFGIGSFRATTHIGRGHSRFASGLEDAGRVRLVDRDMARSVFPPLHERAARARTGGISRIEVDWDGQFRGASSDQRNATPDFFAVHDGPEGPDGYVTYRVRPGGDITAPAGTLLVRELIALTPAAYASLWRFCLSVDLITEVEGQNRPVDEPLQWLLADPRRLTWHPVDALWVRVLDAREALVSRGYEEASELILEVRDRVCPWNEGRFVLSAGPDGASYEPTNEPPHLTLEINELGSLLLGAVSPSVLIQSGRIRADHPEAVDRAEALFHPVEVPWCPYEF